MIKTTMTALMITATLFFALVLRASDPAAEKKLQQAIDFLESKGDLARATPLFEQVTHSSDRELAARSLLYLGQIQERQGKDLARATYQRIIKEFANQREAAAEASRRLAGLGDIRSTSSGMVLSKISTGSFNRVSPDGRYLVGASTSTGLFIHDVSSGTDRYLARSSATEGRIDHPCFTPDGKRIVYEWGQGDLHEIRAINIDGTGEQTVLKSTEYSTFEVSAISPDGKLAAVGLVLAAEGGPGRAPFWQIGLVSLQTGAMKILTSLDWRDTYSGNFSPDGRWLVYSSQVSKEAGDGAIYAVAVDGSAQHTLVAQPVTNSAPFFSPDGSKVVFVSGTGLIRGDGLPAGVFLPLTGGTSRKALYSIGIADGKPLGPPEIVKENLSTGYFSGGGMGFARDGSFYFNENANQNSIYVAEVDASTWKLRNAPKEISDPFRHESVTEPAWSPNGKLLAFVDNTNEDKIVIHDFDSGRERELSTHVTKMTFRGWLPDGKSVLLAGPPTGVRLFDTETQHERPLSLVVTGPVISSTDGKYLLFFRGDDAASRTAEQPPTDGPVHLIRRDLQTGEEKELYRAEAWRASVAFLAASPDGRNLSFAYARPGNPSSTTFWVFPLSGGEPRPLPSFGASRSPVAWTQDGKAVLFVRSDEIWVQPIDGSQAYSTGIRIEGLNSPSVHPDGSRIAFIGRKNSSAVWKLQNLFPQASATK